MKVFLQNRNFRQLTINQWISTVGDTIFYLAFLNYVADASFAPLAILLITISETLPQVLQIFLGVLADFQHHRVLKYTMISFAKFLLYSIVSLWALTNGITKTIVGFKVRKTDKSVGTPLVWMGILGIVAGLIMMGHPLMTGLYISYTIAFVFIYQGIVAIVQFFKIK